MAEDREQALVSAAMLPSSLSDKRAALAAGRFKEACPAEWRDEEQDVFDAIMRSEIEPDDIVVLSDGRCYSKESMRQWLRAGIAGGESRQRVLLPLSQTESTDDDYIAVGLQAPSAQQLRNAYGVTLQTLYGEPQQQNEESENIFEYYDANEYRDDDDDDRDRNVHPLTWAAVEDFLDDDLSYTRLKERIDYEPDALQVLNSTDFPLDVTLEALDHDRRMNVQAYIAMLRAIRTRVPNYLVHVDQIPDLQLQPDADNEPAELAGLQIIDAAPELWRLRYRDGVFEDPIYARFLGFFDATPAIHDARQEMKAFIKQLVLGTRDDYAGESWYGDDEEQQARAEVANLIRNYVNQRNASGNNLADISAALTNELTEYANRVLRQRFPARVQTRSMARQEARRLQRPSPL
jgi:hypothetical protein